MARSYRRQSLIEAPVEQVWDVISDPKTHPDWWPEVRHVEAPDRLVEGESYTRTARRLSFLDLVDAVWVAERVEQMKEVHFRCTVTGTYTRFGLTPAQGETFVEIEAGVEPTGVEGRVLSVTGPLWIKGWLEDLLDALPEAVATKTP